MFTGIIKNIGVIKELTKKNNGYFLSVISNLNFTKKDIGTSISCSGVCLTLTKISKPSFGYILFRHSIGYN